MVAHAQNFKIPEKCLKARRIALESLYCGSMNVYIDEPVTDEKTHITSFERVLLLENVPCRLSSQTVSKTTKNEPAEGAKDVRVHLAPEVEIPAGSVLEITQHEHTEWFKCSSRPSMHVDFQAIELEAIEEHV